MAIHFDRDGTLSRSVPPSADRHSCAEWLEYLWSLKGEKMLQDDPSSKKEIKKKLEDLKTINVQDSKSNYLCFKQSCCRLET